MEELQDPGAIDGVVDGLPGLEVGERREAGVERGIRSALLGVEKDAGRILDGQGLKSPSSRDARSAWPVMTADSCALWLFTCSYRMTDGYPAGCAAYDHCRKYGLRTRVKDLCGRSCEIM